MSFYKGYIVCKDKQPVERFKNRTDFKTYNDVKNNSEYAGVLADDAVLIDVDDKEQSEILLQIVKDKQLKCRVYESRKGMHFLFKNSTVDKCFTKKALAIGLIDIDCKVGKSNSYEVLKIEGKERPVLYDTGEYEEIPKWLTRVNKRMEFLDMEAPHLQACLRVRRLLLRSYLQLR